ncbi:hypothetical protein [Paenibacillus physcomitrellae]|uniref:Phage abortive infection protein n=1 Tax=Paenibacillus physcomitrellae TaxID=1619311 RepID=A0ABQ1FVH1_9BACL|nr:hypothetical protein [Paenibacillus physcomitrellae]GGA31556.1 hypothetical protein GCM10010917_15830 [Paenibacillus physcomitrellae]
MRKVKIKKKIRVIKHWELHGAKYVLALFLITIIGALYVVIRYSNLISKAEASFKDPGFIGIFGSLLGALVGGLMSIIAAVYVNNKQSKSKAYLVKMNVTYKPLYDELIELKSILEQNPYPNYFRFEKGTQTLVPHPQFNAWERIKSDSRYLFVPNYIKTEFSNFYVLVEEYLTSRYQASQEIQDKINEVLFRMYLTTCTIQNLGEVITSKIVSNDDENGSIFSFYFDDALNPRVTLNDQQKAELTEIIFEECNNLSSARQLKWNYICMTEKIDELIFCIGTIIEIINKKYENHSAII